jgi:hypothetical protein
VKRVVSVSLGSARRDHAVRVRIGGEEVSVERRGTDGDVEAAVALIRSLDGRVDAIGLGGLDVYLVAGGRRYVVRDGERLLRAAAKTPVVDGSGVKHTLERDVVYALRDQGILGAGTKVLMVSGVDRFGMAEALVAVGCDVTFGDLLFTAGIPYPIRTMAELVELAGKALPEMAKLPLAMLYPTGKAQEERRPDPKLARYYLDNEVVAGDWHLIHRHLPASLPGKVVLTNTTTAEDVAELAAAGVALLVTTTPVMQGRSFGTNVVEALVVALSGERPEELGEEGYRRWLSELDLQPTLRWLSGRTGPPGSM